MKPDQFHGKNPPDYRQWEEVSKMFIVSYLFSVTLT